LPLSSYGILFVGVAVGGLLMLVIFNMLAMAHRQDEDQDRLEIELGRGNLSLAPVIMGEPLILSGSRSTPTFEATPPTQPECA
jgi:hypothetical protein